MKTRSTRLLFSLVCFTILGFNLNSCKQQKEYTTEFTAEDMKELSVFNAADKIINEIKPLKFPDNTYNIMDFGAIADGESYSTQAIHKAIKICNETGGGTVIIPAGKYLTGPIHLKSHVNLHLEEGAEVLFTKDKKAYLPVVHTSYEGVELMNYSPLIYAYKQTNIAITGKGTFNGQADNTNWWPWCGSKLYGYVEGQPKQKDTHNLPTLRTMNENATPVSERVFGGGHQLRPQFFQPFECTNVLVEGVTFINAPFWNIHPIKCTNVRVDGVTISSHGPNNDGCNPEYSKNIHITNCVFDTGDDCIAIKSGRNDEGRRINIPSENIVVENCIMKDGHGGVVIGSEISAGVRNVYVRNCKMDSPNLERAIRIKTNTLRGGFVENIFVENIQVGQVKEAVLKINTYYGIYANQEGNYMPTIKNIHLADITVEKGGFFGILIKGRKKNPVKNVTLTNVHIKGAATPLSIENSDPIVFKNSSINGKNY